jgi:hypothetical protein
MSSPGKVTGAEHDQATDEIGSEQGQGGRHRGSPVLAHDHGGILVQRIEEADDVSGEVHERVVMDSRGRIGGAVAALIWGHSPVASLGQCAELVTERIPELGEAVKQEDQWLLSGFGHVHVDSTGTDVRWMMSISEILSRPSTPSHSRSVAAGDCDLEVCLRGYEPARGGQDRQSGRSEMIDGIPRSRDYRWVRRPKLSDRDGSIANGFAVRLSGLC